MILSDLFDQLNVRWVSPGQHRHATSGRLQTDCNLCGQGGFHLGWRTAGRPSCTCWRCGSRNAGEALAGLANLSVKHAWSLLLGVDRGRELIDVRPTGRYAEPPGVGDLLKPHRRYLKGRGFDPDVLAEVWGVQGIGMAARLPWRLFIPIEDRRGKKVSWTTRTLVDSGGRYWTASPEEESLPAKSLLYGEKYCGNSIVVCYSSDTEILTTVGWVAFPLLTMQHRVAQYHQPERRADPGCVEFVQPTAIQNLSYQGPMRNFVANWCDLLVTPDHRMIHAPQDRFSQICLAKDMSNNTRFPVAGRLNSDITSGLSDAQIRLLVSFLADGHWESRGQKIAWGFSKKRKQKRFRLILKESKIPYKESTRLAEPGRVFFRLNKQDIPRLDLFRPDKQWPWECLQWSEEERTVLLEEVPYWDGDRSGPKGFRFFTSKKQPADVIAAIAAVTGTGCTTRHKKSNNPVRADEWILNMVQKAWRYIQNTKTRSNYVPYRGQVHCCTVPSGLLVVRRNGKTTISGNCEGPADVWATGPGAVCTFGLSYTRAQVLKIARYPVRYVAYDAGAVAQRTARRLCRELEAFPGRTVNVELDAKDAGCAGVEELTELRALIG